eukprot:gene19737-23611_t
MTSEHRMPILNYGTFDHGDFGPWLQAVNNYLLNLIMAKSLKSSADVDEATILVMKSHLYRLALPNMARHPDGECHEVFVFLFETLHGDPPLPLVDDILRDQSVHHPDTGYVNHPLTAKRAAPFQVVSAVTAAPLTPVIDFDAAWRVIIHRMRIRFAGPSSSQAYTLMAELKLGKEEDPNALHSRLQILAARVNRAYEVNEPLITTFNAATFLLQALPDTLRSVVQERLNRSGVGHEEFTTDQMANIATTVYDELLRFKGHAMKNQVMMENLRGFIDSQALIRQPRSTVPSHAAGVISPGDACKYCKAPISQFHSGLDNTISTENCHLTGRSKFANEKWAHNQLAMPRKVQHLHPMLLANINRVSNRQAPLSYDEFEQMYCEPAEPTQPQAYPTGAQPSGSYHAVAPPNTAPETIVHFHSYAITNEDYPTYEDLASADASDLASPPQPPAADTYSADSVQQPAHDPPATEPRTLDP